MIIKALIMGGEGPSLPKRGDIPNMERVIVTQLPACGLSNATLSVRNQVIITDVSPGPVLEHFQPPSCFITF